MLKAQLARALQPPLDTRSEQGLHLLQELDQDLTDEPTAERAATSQAPCSKPQDGDRTCDRVIALLRARLAER